MNTIARIEINQELNGVELYFSVFPIKATRDNLKANGFKWNHKKSCWYAKRTEKTEAVASIVAGTTEEEYKGFSKDAPQVSKKATKKATKANKFGVKVGDFFSASWGWEQTNVNFFQVIALVGESSVRVREVYPEMIEEEAVSGMSADRTYNLDTSKILPPATHASFIKDQENGDLKRLKSFRQDGSHPQFFLTSYADAHYCTGSTEKCYESWYA